MSELYFTSSVLTGANRPIRDYYSPKPKLVSSLNLNIVSDGSDDDDEDDDGRSSIRTIDDGRFRGNRSFINGQQWNGGTPSPPPPPPPPLPPLQRVFSSDAFDQEPYAVANRKDVILKTANMERSMLAEAEKQIESFCPDILLKHLKANPLGQTSSSSYHAACMLVDISGFSLFSGNSTH